MSFETFFYYSLSGCIDKLGFLLLFDEADLIFHREGEIGAEDMADVEVDFFLLSFHF